MSTLQSRLRGLYVVTDPELTDSRTLVEKASLALEGGAKLLQYRNKSASFSQQLDEANALAELCRQFNASFIVNDSPELCLQSNADGVHIGQSDGRALSIRKQIGNRILGVTCHNSLTLAKQAEEDGADYVAFGSLYPSPTKPLAKACTIEELQQASTQLSIPICAIGGITIERSAAVITAGASMIAMISGIFAQSDIKASAQSVAHQFSLEY